jgi:hypothetical protein
VELSEPLIRFAQRLQRASESSDARSALKDADVEIDRWEEMRIGHGHTKRTFAALPFGVQVRLPEGFESKSRPE